MIQKTAIQVMLICFMLLATFAFSNAHSASTIPTKIDTVTVYTNGALITRTGRLALSSGEQVVQLSDFPANLETGSFRVEIANKSVRVGQITTKSVVYRDSQDQEVQTLEQKIRSVDEKIRVQEDLAKAANLQLKLLNSIATGYGKEASADLTGGQASVSSWQQALTIMQSGSTKAYAALRATENEIRELRKDRLLLQSKLNSKRGKTKKSTNVVLSLASDSAINTTATVHYQVDEARWEPAYEARLDTASGRLTVAQKAVIEQSTAEAWNEVKLTLSTSEPDGQTQVPYVSSEFYTLESPRPPVRSRAAAPMMSAASDEFEEVVVTASNASNQWSGNYSLSFPIAGRVDVSNNADQSQRFDLQQFEFDSELITQIAPTQSEKAFLTARFTHTGATPLYGSEMLVFVDGTFSGTAEMPSILPGKEINMPMGQDPRIEIRTVDLAAQNDQSGIFKKQTVVANDLVFEVINRRPNAAEIEVRSAYPVSKHKSLKIEIGDNATPPTQNDVDDISGVALWRKQVEPNETWRIRSQYTITYPSDRILRRTY